MIAFRQLGKMGRLGNSMFQIAATIGIAIDNGVGYGFNHWEYQKYFSKKLPIAPNHHMIKLNEKEFNYSSYEISPEMDYELSGYFQSEKYWEGNKDHVLSYFQFSQPISWISSLAPITSIHIRRGDYLTKPNYHTNLSMDYYREAMKILEPPFYVFSDDPPWCGENFKNIDGVNYISTNNPISDLKLMSQCDNHIIANSSFSWWGAYLNKNPDKIVVAPKDWFGPDGSKNTEDLVPKSWIRI